MSRLLVLMALCVAACGGADGEIGTPLSLDALAQANVEVLDTKMLCDLYASGSVDTDLQRGDTQQQILGTVVEWTLKVDEIEPGGGENVFRVRTQDCVTGMTIVGDVIAWMPATMLALHVRSPEERQRVAALKTGDVIRVKGRIADITAQRRIALDPVIFATGRTNAVATPKDADAPTPDPSEVSNDTLPREVATLIDAWAALNSACRGGIGGKPTTIAACAVRDGPKSPVLELNALGWCFGRRSDEYGAMNNWHRCVSDSYRQDRD